MVAHYKSPMSSGLRQTCQARYIRKELEDVRQARWHWMGSKENVVRQKGFKLTHIENLGEVGVCPFSVRPRKLLPEGLDLRATLTLTIAF